MSPLDSFGLDLEPSSTPSAAPPPVAPKVFVRTVSPPPGLPWEQARAAELEARHSAPMPMQEVTLQMRRLEPWRFGAPGRFAALYVPTRAIGDRLETTVFIDGAPVTVVFLSPAVRAVQRRRLLMVAGVAALGAALIVAAAGAVLTRKAEAEVQLSALETQTASRVRAATLQQRQREQSRALDAATERGAPLSKVLNDLATVSAARSPEAQVVGFHWEAGAMAVEARSEDSPFASRGAWTVRRAAKPIRRGVYLWLLTPPGASASGAEPVVADLKDEKAR